MIDGPRGFLELSHCSARRWNDPVPGLAGDVLLALLLRLPLGELLGRMKTLEHGGTKLSFEDELQGLKHRAEPDSVPPPGSDPDPVVDALSHLRQLALGSPRLAVLEAWNLVMDAFVKAARTRGLALTAAQLEKPRLLTELLREQGRLDPQSTEAFVGLRLLRNKVAHADGMRVSTRDAEAYLDMVAPLLRWAFSQASDKTG